MVYWLCPVLEECPSAAMRFGIGGVRSHMLIPVNTLRREKGGLLKAARPFSVALFCCYDTFSKSLAPCLQIGQMKSAGSSSPSYSYPQITQRQMVLPVSVFATGCGFGLMLFR